MSLEVLMKAEREYHYKINGDFSNGYRIRRTFYQGNLSRRTN